MTKQAPEWVEPLVERIVDALERVERTVRSTRGVPVAGADTNPVPARTTGRQVRFSGGALAGFSLAESTGSAAAKVYLRDGRDATGDIVAVVSLQAGESVRDTFDEDGRPTYGSGLFLDVSTGSVEGAIYTLDAMPNPDDARWPGVA